MRPKTNAEKLDQAVADVAIYGEAAVELFIATVMTRYGYVPVKTITVEEAKRLYPDRRPE